jgi:hypothetical protein
MLKIGPKCASINDPCLSNNPCTTGQGVCVNNYYGSYTCKFEACHIFHLMYLFNVLLF